MLKDTTRARMGFELTTLGSWVRSSTAELCIPLHNIIVKIPSYHTPLEKGVYVWSKIIGKRYTTFSAKKGILSLQHIHNQINSGWILRILFHARPQPMRKRRTRMPWCFYLVFILTESTSKYMFTSGVAIHDAVFQHPSIDCCVTVFRLRQKSCFCVDLMKMGRVRWNILKASNGFFVH